MMEEKCVVSGCGEQGFRRWDGQPYCEGHYNEEFMKDLASSFESWELGQPPPKRFLYLLGRYCEEYARCTGDSYLTNARVRDRSFDQAKTADGCTFSITRHLNAWNERRSMTRMVELWEVDLKAGLFQKVGERKWTQDDPD